MIIRSARADEYFNKMQKLGFIEVVRDLDEKEVADTQMHALEQRYPCTVNCMTLEPFALNGWQESCSKK